MNIFHAAMVCLGLAVRLKIASTTSTSDVPELARVFVSDVGSALFHFRSHRRGAICGTVGEIHDRYSLLG
jgi:hypothetical protein